MAFEREKVPVIISTQNTVITGVVYLPKGGRLTDFINNVSKGFVPLTDAVIERSDGKIVETELLQVNKDYIVYILPQETLKKS